MEAYVHGVSTRSVDDLVQALGIDTGISKSEVSRICAGLDDAVTAFRTRTLGHTGFPYVYLDATYLHVRDDPRTELPGQVVSKAVVIATGITAAGGREVLGLAVGDREEETFWRAFLTDLKTRGLSGVDVRGAHAHRLRFRSMSCWRRCRPVYDDDPDRHGHALIISPVMKCKQRSGLVQEYRSPLAIVAGRGRWHG